MRAVPAQVLVLLVLASVLASAGEQAAAPSPQDPRLLKTLQSHLDAKLKDHMVDVEYERSRLRGDLLAKGATPPLLEKLTDPETGDEEKARIKKQLVASGVEAKALERYLDPPSPISIEVLGLEDVVVRGERAQAVARVKLTDGGDEARWEVRFKLEDPRRPLRSPWEVADIRFEPPEFGLLNWSVLVAYLVGMLAIGWWTSRFIRTTRGYFIADGRLNYFVVGVSILTAYLSALTMMALPGAAFGKLDWLYAVQLPFLILTAYVITRFVLKRYRDAGVISVYEFLERRIHVSARLLASLCFILFAIGRMGLVLYLPAQAFHIITGFSLPWTIVVMGAVVTVYTIMGGMEAVIWTDFAQAFVMLAGALLSVASVLMATGGQFGAIAGEYHKFRMVAPGFDFTKILTAWLVLETIFQTIRIYGTQQDITQRYMTTPSTADANRSVWIAICGFIPLGFLFFFIGSALFVFYKINPDPTVAGLIAKNRADSIYPYFVASHLPPVVGGLVIAAIFAAAMSSIDACMNANSTVCVEDFYRRLGREEKPDDHYLRVARWLTLAWGALATAMALSFINIRFAQILWGKIMGISTNGVLGLMALAFLKRPVRKVPAVVGFVVSYLCLFAMIWFVQVKPTFAITYPVPRGATINFLLWPVIGNSVCFLVAFVLDRLLPGRARPQQETTQ